MRDNKQRQEQFKSNDYAASWELDLQFQKKRMGSSDHENAFENAVSWMLSMFCSLWIFRIWVSSWNANNIHIMIRIACFRDFNGVLMDIERQILELDNSTFWIENGITFNFKFSILFNFCMHWKKIIFWDLSIQCLSNLMTKLSIPNRWG